MLGKNIFRGDLNMFLPKTVYYEKKVKIMSWEKNYYKGIKIKGYSVLK